jgi:hypothetical protein
MPQEKATPIQVQTGLCPKMLSFLNSFRLYRNKKSAAFFAALFSSNQADS